MFIDATTLPGNTVIETDLCIIGAGAAGITLARDLSGSNQSVALFESGGFDFDQETQDLYKGDVIGQPYDPLDMDRLRYFGGTTNHWGGFCRPFDAIDFEDWPFGRDVLEPYYRRAQDICQLGPYNYEPAYWATDTARPLDLGPGARIYNGIYQLSPPTRFGPVYRQDLDASANVRVYLKANLVDIETNDTASEVTGLAMACLHGPRFRARARHYVLATGGIENARLLLNSNKVQKPGLGNGHGLVGRYYMDHAQPANVATILFTDPQFQPEFYADHVVRDQRVRGYLALSPEIRKQENLPACGITLNPGDPHDVEFAKESLHTLYDALKSGRLPEHLSLHVSRVLTGIETRAIQKYQKFMSKTPETFSTTYVVGCPPDPESRVTLTGAVDALGLRRVQLNWRLPSDFEEKMRRAHEIFAEDLGRKGIGRLRMNSAETGHDPMTAIDGAWHQLGTTRMHADPKQGVVDANCRVHGIENLFIAGSSVYPSYSFDNPTMTIVALSLRLSDHLKSLST